jgi:hypothetical protein
MCNSNILIVESYVTLLFCHGVNACQKCLPSWVSLQGFREHAAAHLVHFANYGFCSCGDPADKTSPPSDRVQRLPQSSF